MEEIIRNLTMGTIGAIIALFLRESFAWKGQGRTEAIKRYETLLTECYGKLLLLVSRLEARGNAIKVRTEEDIRIRTIYDRFSYRFPKDIDESLEKILYDPKKGEFIQFDSHEQADGFISSLEMKIRFIRDDIKSEIIMLESFTQSLLSRIWYIFFVWNFRSKRIYK